METTKELKNLSENEVNIFLEKLKFRRVKSLLKEFGGVTGELIEDLDDESLKRIGIDVSLNRKVFLKSMQK